MTVVYWTLPRSIVILLTFSLLTSVLLNTLVAFRLIQAENLNYYSYEGDDHPNRLPLHIPPVALMFEDSEQFTLAGIDAWAEWRAMDAFPKGNGFVRLGPNRRAFGVSMFHQMHCLQILRNSILMGDADEHTQHCLNFLRQGVLCASDTTLDPLDVTINGTTRDGWCRADACVSELGNSVQICTPEPAELIMGYLRQYELENIGRESYIKDLDSQPEYPRCSYFRHMVISEYTDTGNYSGGGQRGQFPKCR